MATTKKEKKETLDHEFLSEATQAFLINGKTLQDLKGITDKEMEAVYTTAYNFYNHGKYDEAENIFSVLTQYNHFEPKYFLGLGAARHMKKNYKRALESYSFAAMVDYTNPHPSLYAADCLISLGEFDTARKALDAAVAIAKTDPKHAEVLKKAENLLKSIQAKEKTKK